MNLRVLIVAEHASARFGGEAALPLHYYRILRRRGVPTWLIVHERTRNELEEMFPQDQNISYVPDTVWHRLLWRLGSLLPNRLSYFTTGFAMRIMTQVVQRRLIRQIVEAENINIIHQPIPVSPKEPSMIFGMGVPVVIGPMNGGMDYPPAFQQQQSPIVNAALKVGRKFSNLMNTVIPGKKQAAMLLVSNERTRQALPQGVCDQVVEMVENGVNLSLWHPVQAIADPQNNALAHASKPETSTTRYVFMGRLVDWKAVDLLLLAFQKAASQASISLTIIGDGADRNSLEQQARELNLLSTDTDELGKVFFAGWLSQQECSDRLQQFDALVLPSLLECGGAVVLEAMAKGLPVIATNWGGPVDYLDSDCGILVEPSSREGLIDNLAIALLDLAKSPQERVAMGKAGQEKVVRLFDWEAKVDQMTEIYQQIISGNTAKSAQSAPVTCLSRKESLNKEDAKLRQC